MIRITNTAGLDLHISPGQRLLTETAAGWLADEVLPPSGYSYPIRFPLSEANRRFLGGAYQPVAAMPQQRIAVTLSLAGMMYRRAVLYYRIAEGMGDGTLRFDGGEVVPDLKRLSLQDVFSDVVAMPAAASGNVYDLPGRMLAAAQAAPGSVPMTFFPLRNDGFWADTDVGKASGLTVQPYVNRWNGQTFLRDTTGKLGFPVVPFFYLTYILEGILARVGYRLSGDWADHAETRRLVIVNQTAIRGRSLSVEGYPIRPGEHLPAMKCSEFLKALRTQFGLLFSYDANAATCTVRRYVDVAADTQPTDLTRFLAGRWGIDNAALTGYIVEEGRDSADALFQRPGLTNQPEPLPATRVTIGEPGVNATALTLPAAAVQMVYEPGVVTDSRWLLPTLKQAGNALDVVYKDTDRAPDAQGRLKNVLPLKLLSYRGLQPDSTGTTYPLASADVRDARWNKIGERGLNLTGTYGLWAQSLRLFYHFRDQCRPVTVRTRLPLPVLSQLRLHRPVRLDIDRLGATRLLINKLQAEGPGADGFCLCRLELLTLPAGLELPTQPIQSPVWAELITVADATWTHDRANFVWISVKRVTLKVRLWADRNRSQAVPTGSVAINLRIRQQQWLNVPLDRNGPTSTYEYPMTTVATGDGAVIYTGYTDYRWNENREGGAYEDTQYRYALDPGEDYNLF